jgi:hypothetical protein
MIIGREAGNEGSPPEDRHTEPNVRNAETPMEITRSYSLYVSLPSLLCFLLLVNYPLRQRYTP